MDIEYLINQFNDIWKQNNLSTENEKVKLLSFLEKRLSKIPSGILSENKKYIDTIMDLDKILIEDSMVHHQLLFVLYELIGVVILSTDNLEGQIFLDKLKVKFDPYLQKITYFEKMKILYINSLIEQLSLKHLMSDN